MTSPTPDTLPSGARDILAALVGFQTLSTTSNLALIEWIETYLAHFDTTLERIESDDGERTNLLARIGPAVEGGVVLSGHTDVVPVAGQHWQSDPFTLTERDGRLYGRGSCDMKGFIACALAALPGWCALARRGALQRPVWLALSFDEEIGCLGAPRMIEHLLTHHPRPSAVIVGEPTLMAPVRQQKGITTLRTVVHGTPAHSSQLHQGLSAIHIAAKLVVRLEEIMAELIAEGRINDAFNVPHSSLHVGRIEGGEAINIMAQRCQFDWEIRHLPEDGFDALLARFNACCDALYNTCEGRGLAIDTECLAGPVPALADRDNEAAVALVRALGIEKAPQAVAFATEAGQFQAAGLATVICGPGSIEQAHRADEFISLQQLEAGEHFMQSLGEVLTRHHTA